MTRTEKKSKDARTLAVFIRSLKHYRAAWGNSDGRIIPGTLWRLVERMQHEPRTYVDRQYFYTANRRGIRRGWEVGVSLHLRSH